MRFDYDKEQFKLDMLEFIKDGYDPVSVGRKATSVFCHRQADINAELQDILLDVMTMEDGPEFEMTREEFVKFLESI